MAHILLVEDDFALRELVALALEKHGHRVTKASSVAEARTAFHQHSVDAVVSDIYLPGEDGLTLLAELKDLNPELPILLMTARGTLETVTVAARIGAFDYLPKPFDVNVLVDRVEAAVRPPTPATVPAEHAVQSLIVGSHPSIVEVYKAVARLAPLRVAVLILGETGTGKELVARALHQFGGRANGPFVAINCGAVPDSLLESELFGYVRGAFTDARRDHRGAIARAHGGTLFLDEIGDTSPAFQVKLLRFLQEGVVQPLGAEESFPVDVRVLAATHHNLKELIAAGRFREDLYFRLAGYEIHLPPLRARREDIPLLVEHFRHRLAAELGFPPPPPPSPEVLALLTSHPWPGNVRQLEQVMRRCLIDDRSLADAGLVRRVLGELAGDAPPAIPAPPPATSTLAEAEKRHIQAVLAATGGNRSAAARILGIERKTLLRKIRALGIELA